MYVKKQTNKLLSTACGDMNQNPTIQASFQLFTISHQGFLNWGGTSTEIQFNFPPDEIKQTLRKLNLAN